MSNTSSSCDWHTASMTGWPHQTTSLITSSWCYCGARSIAHMMTNAGGRWELEVGVCNTRSVVHGTIQRMLHVRPAVSRAMH